TNHTQGTALVYTSCASPRPIRRAQGIQMGRAGETPYLGSFRAEPSSYKLANTIDPTLEKHCLLLVRGGEVDIAHESSDEKTFVAGVGTCVDGLCCDGSDDAVNGHARC